MWETVSTVELCLEVCASRFTCAVPLAVVVADFGNNHALVRGSPVPKAQCSGLRGSGSALEAAGGWSCSTAGVAVSAGKDELTQAAAVTEPAVGQHPLTSL